MTNVHSFPPISAPTAEKLILGSMPGKASLAANQYYAHPRNYFWKFMSAILNIASDLPYETRCEALTSKRVALWDVLKACTRSSSLDSDIVESSIVPNDFEGFLRSHPSISIIFFNGAKAERIYTRHIKPHLPQDLADIRTIRLPSTSPANASISLSLKREQWKIITVGA